MIKFYIKAEVNALGRSDQATPLVIAVQTGNLKSLRMLLYHNSSTSVTDKKGYTPIRHSVEIGHFKGLALLMAKGSSANIPNKALKAFLMRAGHFRIVWA